MSIMLDRPEVRALPATSRSRNIPAPTRERESLKVSVYERMSKGNVQLMPLFPYDDAGAMVPCGALMYGGKDRDHGHFFHWNTVSELLISWGSSDGMIATGSLMATQPFHGVNSFLRDQFKEGQFSLVTVTQRQSDEEGQREALTAKCTECKQDLVKFEYAAAPSGAPDYDPEGFGGGDDEFHQFSTQWGMNEFEARRNSDEGRVCKNCGHVNELFPADKWGFKRIYNQTRVANAAFHALQKSADEVLG